VAEFFIDINTDLS